MKFQNLKIKKKNYTIKNVKLKENVVIKEQEFQFLIKKKRKTHMENKMLQLLIKMESIIK